MIKKMISKYGNMPQQVKASLWFVICGFLQKAISLLTTPIFTRLLTTSEYGVINTYQSWQNIIIIFASLNLASGVYLRGMIKHDDDQEEFTRSLQSLYLVNFIVVFCVYAVFHSFWDGFFKLPTNYVCLIFGDIGFQVAFHFWSARQRVKFQYRALVALSLAIAILRPTLGIYAVTHSPDRVFARVTTMVLADAIVFGYLFFTMFLHKGKIISTKYWKYALAYNIPLVPHYLSQIVLNQSDRIMINDLAGSDKAGIYSLAYSAAAILTIVNQSVLNSYNPWMYQKIKEKQYKSIGKVSVLILAFIAALNLMLIICAPEVVAIMSPKAYHGAVSVIPPVTMSVYFMFLYSLFANFEFYFEKTKYMMVASVVGAALNVALNYIFIPIYGYEAAGYTTLVCYVCYSLAHYVLMRQILKQNMPGERVYNMKIIMLITFVFVIAGSGSLILYEKPMIRYAIIGAVMIAALIMRKKLMEILKTITSLKKKGNKKE